MTAQSAFNRLAESSLRGREHEHASKRVRLRRPIYIAQLISYAVSAAILYLYHLIGVTTAATPLCYLAAGAGWVAISVILSETHVNDHFSDQYAIVPQSIGSITIQLVAIYFAPEVGFYFVCTLFVILGFGALRIGTHQATLIWTYAVMGLACLFMLTDKPLGIPANTPFERDLALLTIAATLGRCASTGLYGSSLRDKLLKRGNDLKAAHAKIEELAQVDELTGTLNRRYIMRALNEELLRVQRMEAVCCVAIIDVDFFKRINDTYGHPAGDDVLQRIAETLTRTLRGSDKIGRYGGEEFLLVLPGSRGEDARTTLERLRQAVAALKWQDLSGDCLRVTVSAGLTEIQPADTAKQALARADEALYRAKAGGRDSVAFA